MTSLVCRQKEFGSMLHDVFRTFTFMCKYIMMPRIYEIVTFSKTFAGYAHV